MTAVRIWTLPTVFALVSLIGLIAGLLGDGAWDWVSWAGLGLPVVACAWFGSRRRSRG